MMMAGRVQEIVRAVILRIVAAINFGACRLFTFRLRMALSRYLHVNSCSVCACVAGWT